MYSQQKFFSTDFRRYIESTGLLHQFASNPAGVKEKLREEMHGYMAHPARQIPVGYFFIAGVNPQDDSFYMSGSYANLGAENGPVVLDPASTLFSNPTAEYTTGSGVHRVKFTEHPHAFGLLLASFWSDHLTKGLKSFEASSAGLGLKWPSFSSLSIFEHVEALHTQMRNLEIRAALQRL